MLSYFLISFTTILTIVNPIGAIGPYLAMTENDSLLKKRRIAFRASIVSSIILAVCAFSGAFLFKFYGITLPAVKIAGGILLFFIAFDMINARASRMKTTDEEQMEGVEKEDVAVFPLAIPLLSGPGAIVSVFMLSDKTEFFYQHMILISAILVTGFLTYIVLSLAPKLVILLGQIGMNILNRLMGLMLAAIAIQFVLDGIKAAFSLETLL